MSAKGTWHVQSFLVGQLCFTNRIICLTVDFIGFFPQLLFKLMSLRFTVNSLVTIHERFVQNFRLMYILVLLYIIEINVWLRDVERNLFNLFFKILHILRLLILLFLDSSLSVDYSCWWLDNLIGVIQVLDKRWLIRISQGVLLMQLIWGFSDVVLIEHCTFNTLRSR